MNEQTPENQLQVSPEVRQKQEDFHASSPETQDALRARDESEAWELHAEAHEIYRDEALADVRARLDRLEQSGVEVTPEMEARELEHAEESIEKHITLRGEKGYFKGSARIDAIGKDAEDGRALDAAVRERKDVDEYKGASKRVAGKIERAAAKEQLEVRDLAEKLRREDALKNVENHIANTFEQGARWWPWEKRAARRKALRQLKDKELSADWLAYADKQYYEQQEAHIQKGESLSESRRAVSNSGERIRQTWREGGWKRLVTVPGQAIAETGRLAWHGIKRSRKEVRIQQQKAANKSK